MGCEFNNKLIINESVKRGTATTECDQNVKKKKNYIKKKREIIFY